jgi:hypothetical protein
MGTPIKVALDSEVRMRRGVRQFMARQRSLCLVPPPEMSGNRLFSDVVDWRYISIALIL